MELTKTKLVIFVTFMFVLFAIGSAVYPLYTHDTTKVTVDDKERVNYEDSSKYLVYGEEEVFENTDSIMYFKFNSSDVYRQLEPGQQYQCEVYGWRVPALSTYRNIVECEQVTQ